MDAKRAALLVPCTTKEHLRDWFKVYLDFHVFDTVTSRFATATPLDAAWEVYRFVMFPDQKKPANYLFASARSTQKTITLAALEIAVLLHAKRTVLHFAGSMDQIEAGYTYVKKFLNLPIIRELVDGDITKSQTELLIPDYRNEHWLNGMHTKEIFKIDPDSLRKIKIFVKPITPFTVQGQHESFVGKDEIHTLKGEKAYAYKDIKKIPVASWDGKPWSMVGISSRKSPSSIVEREIDEKDKTGLILKQWTVFEGVERCTEDRNGGDFIHERYINVYDGTEKTVQEFNVYDGKDRDKFSKTTLASGCLSCHLRTVCFGDLAKPKQFNKHHQSVDAAIVDFISDSDRGWYIAQCLSLQPQIAGVVFSRFKRSEFYVSPREMYKRFTGSDPGKDLTKEELIEYMLKAGVKSRMGLDHGFTDPAAFIITYEDKVGTEYMMHASAVPGLDPNKLVEYVRGLWEKYRFTELFPDTAQPSINALLKQLKLFKVIDNFSKKDGIAEGISLIRGKISPMEGGSTKLLGLDGECEPFVLEMEKYSYEMDSTGRFIDVPEDMWNHTIDACRYLALNRWKSKNKHLGLGKRPEVPTETNQEYTDKVVKSKVNWLAEEIREATGGKVEEVGPQSSKTKGAIWDI